MKQEYFDVVIIGAGLSGIGAACHLTKKCPNKTFTVLESRKAMGGTWDLFRYPGIRSDSDMYTLGYNFKPWASDKSLADGPSIKKYIQDTAAEYGIDQKIQYQHRVLKAQWSSEDAKWTLTVEANGNEKIIQCNFFLSCAGYYRYEAGYQPDFPGLKSFKGQLIHPQKWPEGLDYSGKKVVVVGSGATAVTLVPSMADTAEHVTMLQRSPTYVVSVPGQDLVSKWMRRYMPNEAVYRITRTRNVAITYSMYYGSRYFPNAVKKLITARAEKSLGDGFDMKHFSPKYKPWDERMCMVPDGDLFEAIRKKKASIVTDHIETFVQNGVKLKSGKTLEADIVVSATGLVMQFMGGIELEVDGQPFVPSEKMNYKGLMLEDLPNCGSIFGYTNASWTLKADLISEYVCRILNKMDEKGVRQCMPVNQDESLMPEPLFDMSSGYLQRALHLLPKQGSKSPWKLYQNYALDMAALRFGRVEDGVLQFSNGQ